MGHDIAFVILWLSGVALMGGAVYFWYRVIKRYYNMLTGKDLDLGG